MSFIALVQNFLFNLLYNSNMTRFYETIQQSKFYLVLYTVRTSIYFKGIARKGAWPPYRNVVSDF